MVTTPHKAAFGSPATQKPSVIRMPWITDESPVPSSVDVVTSRKSCRNSSVLRAEKGMYGRTASHVSRGRGSRY